MSEYDLPTTMNGGALLLALLGITLAVVMLAILRQRADADTAAPQSPAPARPCLCGHGALDHDDNGDCAGVYTYRLADLDAAITGKRPRGRAA